MMRARRVAARGARLLAAAPAGRACAVVQARPAGLLSGSWAVKGNGWDPVSCGEKEGVLERCFPPSIHRSKN